MASANKATVLEQLQTAATKIKAYILQQISDLSDAVMAAIPDTYAGSASAGGPADKAVSIPMGQLDSTSTATVMTAQVDGITKLRNGVCVWLKNGVVTSASGVTLDINGLGAKPLYSSLAAASRSTTIFNINYTLLLVYNSTRVEGGCWDVVYGIDSNTTYSPVSLGFGYGVCSTAAATAAKTVAISSYKLTVGGYVTVRFDNDVPANATLNVNTRGAKAIYHKGTAITAGVIKAGDIVTFCYNTYYHVVAIIPAQDQPALPAVSSSDNGKVMTVVDGAWAAAEAAGGSTPDIVIRSKTYSFSTAASNYLLEHGSIDAILAKIQENKPINGALYSCFHDTVEEEWDYDQWHMRFISMPDDLSYANITFSTWGGQQPFYQTLRFSIDQNGNITSVSKA